MSDGPNVIVRLSCIGCGHRALERDDHLNDPGYNRVCAADGARRDLGYSGDTTPEWCPLLPSLNKLRDEADRKVTGGLKASYRLEDDPPDDEATASRALGEA